MNDTAIQMFLQAGALGVLVLVLIGIFLTARWLGPKVADYLAAQTAALGEIRTSVATGAVGTQSAKNEALARIELAEARILARIDSIPDCGKEPPK